MWRGRNSPGLGGRTHQQHWRPGVGAGGPRGPSDPDLTAQDKPPPRTALSRRAGRRDALPALLDAQAVVYIVREVLAFGVLKCHESQGAAMESVTRRRSETMNTSAHRKDAIVAE